MTTDVSPKPKDDIGGQSILEFLLIIPTLIGFVSILIRVNTAIQISIVNQQYGRAQAHFLTYASAVYPDIGKQDRLIRYSTNQLILGVEDFQTGENGGAPTATVQRITRSASVVAPDQPGEEPTTRAKVRIRNTVTLCTPSFFLTTAATRLDTMPLPENARFTYCGSTRPHVP